MVFMVIKELYETLMKRVFPPPLQILSLEHVVLEQPTEKSNPVQF